MPLLTARLLLTEAPLWVAAIILLVPTTIYAVLGPAIVRRYVPLESLRINNEVAGFKFATVGVIYAVLLAFAIIIVWERFNQADSDVANEASAAATVFRLTAGLDTPHAAAVRKAATGYLQESVSKDWPAMDHGESSQEVTVALSSVYQAVLRFHTSELFEGIVVAEILRNVDRISDMRRQRLVAATGIVPGIIWAVLFTGAFLTISFTFFFGTANVHAQCIMSGALAFLIFLGLLTIVAIDHPFAGAVKVRPEALIAVIRDFGERAPP
ncbi:MAG TPA: DUF4239 domain-containing protein [Pseudolabrys sp.]|jgi:hypothetical protein|nr:DUF4239 domain-containing protein [Pseudolabrys sp.]